MSSSSQNAQNRDPVARGTTPGQSELPDNKAAPPDQVLLTKIGLRMPEQMAFEHWERTGNKLAGIVDSTSWCLGDWLVYGRRQYADRYQHVVNAVGLDYQTLRNYAWVAGRFGILRRRPQLSFQHHAEVAALRREEQDGWLDEAERAKLSVKQLRSLIKMARSVGVGSRDETALLPRIAVPDRRLNRWREAADQSRTDFDDWVVNSLDKAAAEALDKPSEDAA
jgi:hypothetical protein